MKIFWKILFFLDIFGKNYYYWPKVNKVDSQSVRDWQAQKISNFL